MKAQSGELSDDGELASLIKACRGREVSDASIALKVSNVTPRSSKRLAGASVAALGSVTKIWKGQKVASLSVPHKGQ